MHISFFKILNSLKAWEVKKKGPKSFTQLSQEATDETLNPWFGPSLSGFMYNFIDLTPHTCVTILLWEDETLRFRLTYANTLTVASSLIAMLDIFPTPFLSAVCSCELEIGGYYVYYVYYVFHKTGGESLKIVHTQLPG
jgi:hypothetical protein